MLTVTAPVTVTLRSRWESSITLMWALTAYPKTLVLPEYPPEGAVKTS